MSDPKKNSRVANEIIRRLKELNDCLARGGDIRKEFRTTRVYLRSGRNYHRQTMRADSI